MKILSLNQLRFAAAFFVLTLFIQAAITILLNAEKFALVWIPIPFYIIIVFIAGWYLGRKDNEILPLAVTGFKFHLITYLVANGISLAKHQLGLASIYESINSVYLTIILWGLGLLLHYILFLIVRKGSIKGISKSEIFE
jgi:hypothetical protein